MLLSLLDDNVHYNIDRLSAQQISSVSYSLFRMGVHSPVLQQRLLTRALERANEFDPFDLERLRYVTRICASPMGPGHFHDHPSED